MLDMRHFYEMKTLLNKRIKRQQEELKKLESNYIESLEQLHLLSISTQFTVRDALRKEKEEKTHKLKLSIKEAYDEIKELKKRKRSFEQEIKEEFEIMQTALLLINRDCFCYYYIPEDSIQRETKKAIESLQASERYAKYQNENVRRQAFYKNLLEKSEKRLAQTNCESLKEMTLKDITRFNHDIKRAIIQTRKNKNEAKKEYRAYRHSQLTIKKYVHFKAIHQLLMDWDLIQKTECPNQYAWYGEEDPKKILDSIDSAIRKLEYHLTRCRKSPERFRHHQSFIEIMLTRYTGLRVSYVDSLEKRAEAKSSFMESLPNYCSDWDKKTIWRYHNQSRYYETLLELKLVQREEQFWQKHHSFALEKLNKQLEQAKNEEMKRKNPKKQKTTTNKTSEEKTCLSAKKNSFSNIRSKRNKLQDLSSSGACVYLIRESATQTVKIGKTKNLKQRFYQIQNSSPYNLEIIHTIQTNQMDNVERKLHQMFKQKRINREWFRLNEIDINQIKSLSLY